MNGINVLTALLTVFSCCINSSVTALGFTDRIPTWIRNRWMTPQVGEQLPNRIVIPITIKTEQNMLQSIMLIGGKKKTFGVVFDPSFSGIWVYSKTAWEKKLGKPCNHIALYNDNNIKEDKKNKKFELPYPYGKVSGYIIEDRIEIGQQVLDKQEIGIATEWDEAVVDRNLEGRYGMRVAQKYTKRVVGDSFLDRFITNNVIKEKIYGIYFNGKSQEGQLCLGGVNPRLIEKNADIIPLQVTEGQSGFILEINSIKIGGSEVEKKNVKALVDPASYSFAGNEDLMKLVISEVHKQLPAKKQYSDLGDDKNMINCSDRDNLPVVHFEINGHSFELHGHDYSLKYCQAAVFVTSCRCYLYFFPQETVDADYDMVLGTPFISKYYAQMDLNKMTVGFSKANHDKENYD